MSEKYPSILQVKGILLSYTVQISALKKNGHTFLKSFQPEDIVQKLKGTTELSSEQQEALKFELLRLKLDSRKLLDLTELLQTGLRSLTSILDESKKIKVDKKAISILDHVDVFVANILDSNQIKTEDPRTPESKTMSTASGFELEDDIDDTKVQVRSSVETAVAAAIPCDKPLTIEPTLPVFNDLEDDGEPIKYGRRYRNNSPRVSFSPISPTQRSTSVSVTSYDSTSHEVHHSSISDYSPTLTRKAETKEKKRSVKLSATDPAMSFKKAKTSTCVVSSLVIEKQAKAMQVALRLKHK